MTDEIPDVFNWIGVTGGDREVRYWAHLFRGGVAERTRGPFMTAQAAQAAFLPVKVWPKPQKPPRG